MKALSCIPCSDTPTIDISIDCPSVCCASKVDNDCKHKDNSKSKHSNSDDQSNTPICCSCFKKRKKLKKHQAKHSLNNLSHDIEDGERAK